METDRTRKPTAAVTLGCIFGHVIESISSTVSVVQVADLSSMQIGLLHHCSADTPGPSRYPSTAARFRVSRSSVGMELRLKHF